MGITLKDIAKLVSGELIGDGSIVVSGASNLEEAGSSDVTFFANPRYEAMLSLTKAACVIAPKNFSGKGNYAVIKVDNPSVAFLHVMEKLSPISDIHPSGIHKNSVISKDAKLGKGVSVGANTVIEEGADIGDNTVIYPLIFIGKNTKIGKNCVIYPNVTIRERVIVGNNCIIHPGAVIGSDGFGYVNIENKHHKISQIGTVELEDDVEIGANVTIDRARFEKTVIGKGTKIDNLVQIAHNVKVGKNCLIIAQAGIAGSSEIGENAIIAAQAGINGHIKIGENVIVGAQAGVTKSIEPNEIVLWSPAKPAGEVRRTLAYISRLGDFSKELKELKEKMAKLEKEPNGK